MKYFTLNTRSVLLLVFLIFFSFCFGLLTACRTMRTSEKAVSKSETASVTESRLTFYRTIDSLSRQLSLSADSISIVFFAPGQEFQSAFPSGIEGHLETPSDSVLNPSTASSALRSHRWPRIAKARQGGKPPDNASRYSNASHPSSAQRNNTSVPHRITVYGLHLNENIGEKSIVQADLKDSVTAVTQSENVKSAIKQSSSPSSAPKYIFYILLLACALYGIYRLRRFLK